MEVRIFDKVLEEFIQSLEKPTFARVLRTIGLLKTFGSKLGMPHTKKVVARIFELRVRGEQNVRILYTFHKTKAVLLHGFVKKSNKIPNKEVKIALSKLSALDRI